MSSCLVIVESPAKSRTIKKYLGDKYNVMACYGHIRDLIPKSGSVIPEEGFRMQYDFIAKNRKHVEAIIKAVKSTQAIYLATDPDREGEAIAWHLCEILKARKLLEGRKLHRVVFHEVTSKAVLDAIAHPKTLAANLIHAQQARRALDYLVGFKLSPLLWKKINAGLSAGRVQSPALRMIAEREKEIDDFIVRNYWTIHALNQFEDQKFSTRLITWEGKKLQQFNIKNDEMAQRMCKDISEAAQGRLTVVAQNIKQRRKSPPPPYITSTLQQEGVRRLRISASSVMRTAQQLYEGVKLSSGHAGLITYMRTDSVSLSQEALMNIRGHIEKAYGREMLPKNPRKFKNKSKNAQESHEAIRPTDTARTPQSIRNQVTSDQYKLYDMIWRRSVACQMVHADLEVATIDLAAGSKAIFHASGTSMRNPGYMVLYQDAPSPEKNHENSEKSHENTDNKLLPRMQKGDSSELLEVSKQMHATEPPPRYNEARLIKSLEEHGIGRPSTYASIISVIQNRKYVEMEKSNFYVTDTGKIVNAFLTKHFSRYVDYGFTADLEDQLDAVSRGENDWKQVMENFWGDFSNLVTLKDSDVSRGEAASTRVLGNEQASGKPVSVKLGRYGPYAQIGSKEDTEKPRFASLRKGQSIGKITLEEALKLFEFPRILGTMEDGSNIVANVGRYGPYIGYGSPQRFVTLKSIPPEDITLDQARQLVEEHQSESAQKTIKDFAREGIKVLHGRYGDYITDGKKNVTVPKKDSAQDLTLAECQELLQSPKAKPVKRRKTTARNPRTSASS